MTVSIATWNINSVRLRLDLVARFLQEHQPDVLCLQEIKCADEHFPVSAIREMGYPHVAVHGQKAYHGVATLSRLPFHEEHRMGFCGKEDARHLAVTFTNGAGAAQGVTLHNFYVPAGGDEPDPGINPKFAHKLDFVREMTSWSKKLKRAGAGRDILVGDLNIAPLETDVWSHKQLLKVVSHTPVEVDAMTKMQQAGGWVDVVRSHIPPQQKLFTWWSYRAQDWEASDRGRRLDHVWTSPGLAGRVAASEVLKPVRGWPRPSDHAPVMARLTET